MYFRLKKYILAISAVAVFSLSATAGYPKGYYDSLEGLKGYALMKAVKAVAKNHTEISYGDKTWQAFRLSKIKIVDGDLNLPGIGLVMEFLNVSPLD